MSRFIELSESELKALLDNYRREMNAYRNFPSLYQKSRDAAVEVELILNLKIAGHLKRQ